MTKENMISAELNRISVYFEDVDANQRAIVTPLLQNAAFMKVTLEDLQESINMGGATDEYQNGANQHGIKQSAQLQAYNSLIKNYASVIKTLSGLLPPEKKADALTSFINWEPKEKTPEEWAEERRKADEHQRKLNEQLNAAVEYQRRQREAAGQNAPKTA